jgi:hypothetical protein
MEHVDKVDSLSFLDLDIELLEERIELSTISNPVLYGDYCGTRCGSAHPAPQ